MNAEQELREFFERVGMSTVGANAAVKGRGSRELGSAYDELAELADVVGVRNREAFIQGRHDLDFDVLKETKLARQAHSAPAQSATVDELIAKSKRLIEAGNRLLGRTQGETVALQGSSGQKRLPRVWGR